MSRWPVIACGASVAAFGCFGLHWVVFRCLWLLWVACGCFGMLWDAFGLLFDVVLYF